MMISFYDLIWKDGGYKPLQTGKFLPKKITG